MHSFISLENLYWAAGWFGIWPSPVLVPNSALTSEMAARDPTPASMPEDSHCPTSSPACCVVGFYNFCQSVGSELCRVVVALITTNHCGSIRQWWKSWVWEPRCPGWGPYLWSDLGQDCLGTPALGTSVWEWLAYSWCSTNTCSNEWIVDPEFCGSLPGR